MRARTDNLVLFAMDAQLPMHSARGAECEGNLVSKIRYFYSTLQSGLVDRARACLLHQRQHLRPEEDRDVLFNHGWRGSAARVSRR